jgi:hypothetical protein
MSLGRVMILVPHLGIGIDLTAAGIWKKASWFAINQLTEAGLCVCKQVLYTSVPIFTYVASPSL